MSRVDLNPAPSVTGLASARTASYAELPGLPRDGDEPVFNAPWEAQAFAITLALHERGEFSWSEWCATLAAVIGEVKLRGEADTGADYYRHWLTALERIAGQKGFVTEASLRQRREQWEAAAHRTPHGQPIQL